MFSIIENYMPWILVAGILLSVFYGIRGIIGQRVAVRQNNKEPDTKKKVEWKGYEKVVVLYAHDFLVHFICSIAGLFSLLLVYRLLSQPQGITNLGSGSAIVITFFTIVGLVGITGQLPLMFMQGKFPWNR